MMARDSTGQLTVAYVGHDLDGEGIHLFVHRLSANGSEWPLLGSPRVLAAVNVTLTTWPSLVLDRSGAPLVSFADGVERWDGSAWTVVSGPFPEAPWQPAQLGVTASDTPIALFLSWDGLEAFMRLE